MEIIVEPVFEIGMTAIGLIFLAGLASGIGVTVYITRDYFKKVKAAGKVPTWNDSKA